MLISLSLSVERHCSKGDLSPWSTLVTGQGTFIYAHISKKRG